MQLKLLLLCTFILSPGFQSKGECAPAANAGKIVLRHFSFPTAYPFGKLRLMSDEGEGGENRGTPIGTAQGEMTVRVPPGQSVMLDLNPHCLEHPERLKNIPTEGINRLIISYMSMEESTHICDSALHALPDMKDLISLNVERSDTTDAGLSSFKSLPHVKYLTAFIAGLNGAVLAKPDQLKSLESLCLNGNPIQGKYLKSLKAIPHLQELSLDETNLNDEALQNLPACPHLKHLHLHGNPRITDKSLPVLKAQTGLDTLSISGTNISFAGILSLRNLKLKHLFLTIRRYRPDEIAALEQAFPQAALDYRGRGVDKDKAIMYAPIK